mmetsp:Transcript_2997/g.6216  ORF Transcript_2997/g.6216 Transcript_2997/m.6216 type:complete len:249 (-) Transcript_2997:630-1376(-)
MVTIQPSASSATAGRRLGTTIRPLDRSRSLPLGEEADACTLCGDGSRCVGCAVFEPSSHSPALTAFGKYCSAEAPSPRSRSISISVMVVQGSSRASVARRSEYEVASTADELEGDDVTERCVTVEAPLSVANDRIDEKDKPTLVPLSDALLPLPSVGAVAEVPEDGASPWEAAPPKTLPKTLVALNACAMVVSAVASAHHVSLNRYEYSKDIMKASENMCSTTARRIAGWPALSAALSCFLTILRTAT